MGLAGQSAPKPNRSTPFPAGISTVPPWLPTDGVRSFSRSTDYRPAEHGDARDEYERAYDDRDEPAGVPERPRLRRAVPPTCSGPRGRRGGPCRTPALGGRRTLPHARRVSRLHPP